MSDIYITYIIFVFFYLTYFTNYNILRSIHVVPNGNISFFLKAE